MTEQQLNETTFKQFDITTCRVYTKRLTNWYFQFISSLKVSANHSGWIKDDVLLSVYFEDRKWFYKENDKLVKSSQQN